MIELIKGTQKCCSLTNSLCSNSATETAETPGQKNLCSAWLRDRNGVRAYAVTCFHL